MCNRIPTDDKELAQWLVDQWNEGKGKPKSVLEREVWGDGAAHGKRFDQFVRQHLPGVQTIKASKQSDRIRKLERQLHSLGERPDGWIEPEWYDQLCHARAAALQGVRIWNDPTVRFRTGAFSLHIITAWNSLAIAVIQKNGGEWRRLDKRGEPVIVEQEEKALDTVSLVDAAFPGEDRRGLRGNVKYWVGLRNKVAHRFLPPLDTVAIPKAQATLLNLENALVGGFGEHFGLGNSLSVPLQLAGFRDTGVLCSLKALQASLPLDIQAFLAREGEEGLEGDPTYTMRVAFIPVVPSSGGSPDAVAYFVRPGEVGSELEDALQQYVVVPKVIRTKRPELSATEVVHRVKAEIPYALTTRHHKQAAIRLHVRPADGVADPGNTDPTYCEYVAALRTYLYTEAWVRRLISELATEHGFLRTTGTSPRQRVNIDDTGRIGPSKNGTLPQTPA